MSDDQWRRRERDRRDPSEEFGGPLFPDEDPDTATASDDTGERRLRFGPNDTGPLPHWTDPPTGEVPRMTPAAASDDERRRRRRVVVVHDGVADLARRHRRGPVEGSERRLPPRPERVSASEWRRPRHDRRGARRRAVRADVAAADGRDPARRAAAARARSHHDRHRSVRRRAPPAARSQPPRRVVADPVRPARRPGAHVGGAHPTAAQPAGRHRAPASSSPPCSSSPRCGGRSPSSPSSRSCSPSPAFEYFGKVTEKGYRPAVAPGLAACVAAPLVAYWVGERGPPARRRVRVHRRRRRLHRGRRASSPARCRTWP